MSETLLVLILLALWEINAGQRPVDRPIVRQAPMDPSLKKLLMCMAAIVALLGVASWIAGMMR
jgi:hypothetical protein